MFEPMQVSDYSRVPAFEKGRVAGFWGKWACFAVVFWFAVTMGCNAGQIPELDFLHGDLAPFLPFGFSIRQLLNMPCRRFHGRNFLRHGDPSRSMRAPFCSALREERSSALIGESIAAQSI